MNLPSAGSAAGPPHRPKPLLKWVGGKRQLLPEIHALVPPTYQRYLEPFLGGGAVLWSLTPDRAIVGDLNAELINFYTVVRDQVAELAALVATYPTTAEFFYDIRALDRSEAGLAQLSPLQRAARMLYLNKTCYNGLYRVNKANQFNSPFGHYDNPTVVDYDTLQAVSDYLRRAKVDFITGDYLSVLNQAQPGDFVYLDPPYDPLSATSSFTSYAAGGFSRADQEQLRDACRHLDAQGIRFVLSNSDTPFIRELYAEFQVTTVGAHRAVNSKADGRGKITEVLVSNGPR